MKEWSWRASTLGMALALALLVSGWMPGARPLSDWQRLEQPRWNAAGTHYTYQVDGRNWDGDTAQAGSSGAIYFDPQHPEDSHAAADFQARLGREEAARRGRKQRRWAAAWAAFTLWGLGLLGQRRAARSAA